MKSWPLGPACRSARVSGWSDSVGLGLGLGGAKEMLNCKEEEEVDEEEEEDEEREQEIRGSARKGMSLREWNEEEEERW